MTYYIFAIVFVVVVISTFITFTTNALGQLSNSTLQGGQIYNNTEEEEQSEQQDLSSDKKIIKISSTEFNQLLDEIKGSLNLIQEKKYDAAASKLGLAIIEILNSTQQYQELVQFASSQYAEKIEQQQFNDEQKEN
jgi:hypothetical protein